jgi:hypothetical protein
MLSLQIASGPSKFETFYSASDASEPDASDPKFQFLFNISSALIYMLIILL